MTAALRAEVLKQRTTRTFLGLLAAMLGLSLLVVGLHGRGLSASGLGSQSSQVRVLAEGGEVVGVVFAALLGAMSITSEVRHGTIRPTFLAIPQRSRVLLAKAITSMVSGLAFGVIAAALAAVVGTVIMQQRGITIALGGGDYARLISGTAGAAALMAVVGLGVGAIVRNQVAAVVAIFLWLLLIENTLIDSVPDVAKFMPGALGQALVGQRTGTLDSAALAAALLAVYAVTAIIAGAWALTYRDVG